MFERLPERDWKHLRTIHPLALDRYCKRVLDEAVAIARGADGSNHERYLRLFTLIDDRNRALAQAFDDMRRSTAIERLLAMIQLGLLAPEELAGFSEETRRRVMP